MKVFKPGKRFEYHEYDLLLNKLPANVASELFPLRLNQNLSKEDFDNFRTGIDEGINKLYASLNISVGSGIILEPGDNIYEFYLSYTIIFFDPNKIEFFLDYQNKLSFPGFNFFGRLEHIVYDIIKGIKIIDTTDKQKILIQWIKDNKSKKRGKKEKIHLEWNKDCFKELGKLSWRLYTEKFTAKKKDFEKVFTNKIKIRWKEDCKYLCYLLYKLRQYKKPLFKASEGKGHYVAASLYFDEVSGKLVNENYISDTIHRLVKRKKSKPSPQMNSLDLMLKQVFPNKETKAKH